MAKRRKNLVLMVPEGHRNDYKFSFVVEKSAKMVREGKTLRRRTYNPITRKHGWFIERRMPPHAK